MKIEDLEEGDKILFNERKQPLEAVEISDNEVKVKGPQGGVYKIYEEDDTLLISKNNIKKYASRVSDLRKVGKWQKTEGGWKHSKTDAEVCLVQEETGNWRIESDLEEDLDQPGMGYMNRDTAFEDAEKLIQNNPEGR